MISYLFEKDVFKILSLFGISPGSRFKRNEIKDKTLLYNVNLDKALNKLVNLDLLKKDKNYYQINFENDVKDKVLNLVIKEYKRLREIPFKVYLLLIDMLEKISKNKKTEIYLFGSYAKLIYKENSDVDVAVINGKINAKLINKLEEKYGLKIELHYFNKDEFYKNKKDPLIKEIIKNGVRL